MEHREERDFTISIHLSAVFAEDYEGDDDGFVWHQRFQESVRPALVAAVFDVLRAQPGANVVAAPRWPPSRVRCPRNTA